MHCSVKALWTLPEKILVAVGQEISARNRLEPRRLNAAFRDSLTLLPNRTGCVQQLNARYAQPQSDYQFAVLFIDVDRFKDINDLYGHVAGDQVLQAGASRLTGEY